MRFTRACQPCRTAKVKCDLVRPACSRCRQRGLVCSGFPADAGLIFLDERQTAQRNSERARREVREGGLLTASFELHGSDTTEVDIPKGYYPWLNQHALAEIPTPFKQDLEGRAVDRFFVNWVVHPDNNGLFPGHLQDLSVLYASAAPNSVLWFAVRAVAFADMTREGSQDASFHIKARQQYGAALSRMQDITHDEQSLSNDGVLAAILLIDNFESMYLARNEPLGPHSQAVKNILRLRGNDQLYDRSHFALWRIAHHRLQSRQILLREDPEPQQIAWLSKLDTNRTDIHISADVLHMNILSAAARRLTQNDDASSTVRTERVEETGQLMFRIQELMTTLESWTSTVTGAWNPELIDPHEVARAWDSEDPSSPPLPKFRCPRMLRYSQIWLAYMWNFHAASQIILRESLVEIVLFRASMLGETPSVEDLELIKSQEDAVHRLSSAIVRSFPLLLGFIHRGSQGPHSAPQGKMAGRFFSLFSMWVVQKSRFTSAEHKETALEVTQWINASHGLG